MRRAGQVRVSYSHCQSTARLPAAQRGNLWTYSAYPHCQVATRSYSFHATTGMYFVERAYHAFVTVQKSLINNLLIHRMELHWLYMYLQNRKASIRKCWKPVPREERVATTQCCKGGVRAFHSADWERAVMEIIMESIHLRHSHMPLPVSIARVCQDLTLE